MSGETASPGLYEPLPKGYIRLLRILGTCRIKPKNGRHYDLAIDCSLEAVRLRTLMKQVEYSALSYVWGPERYLRYVVCNGHAKRVTNNLYNCLWQICFSERSMPDRLWIDALCINQADDEEKSHQVASMQKIYAEAEEVLVWLGDIDHTRFDADLDRFWQDYGPRSSRFDVSAQKARSRGADFLSSCSWFSRIWTFQEIALARRARVMCGAYIKDWEILEETIASRVKDISAIQQYRAGREPADFRELLIATATREASDPRDKIYGLLGLCDSVHLTPDYTWNFWRVFGEAAILVARESKALAFLDVVISAFQDIKLLDYTHPSALTINLEGIRFDPPVKLPVRVQLAYLPLQSWTPDFRAFKTADLVTMSAVHTETLFRAASVASSGIRGTKNQKPDARVHDPPRVNDELQLSPFLSKFDLGIQYDAGFLIAKGAILGLYTLAAKVQFDLSKTQHWAYLFDSVPEDAGGRTYPPDVAAVLYDRMPFCISETMTDTSRDPKSDARNGGLADSSAVFIYQKLRKHRAERCSCPKQQAQKLEISPRIKAREQPLGPSIRNQGHFDSGFACKLFRAAGVYLLVPLYDKETSGLKFGIHGRIEEFSPDFYPEAKEQSDFGPDGRCDFIPTTFEIVGRGSKFFCPDPDEVSSVCRPRSTIAGFPTEPPAIEDALPEASSLRRPYPDPRLVQQALRMSVPDSPIETDNPWSSKYGLVVDE